MPQILTANIHEKKRKNILPFKDYASSPTSIGEEKEQPENTAKSIPKPQNPPSANRSVDSIWN